MTLELTCGSSMLVGEPMPLPSATELVLGASGPVQAVAWLLLLASAVVWLLIAVKARQLGRWYHHERAFEHAVGPVQDVAIVHEVCRRHPDALGARLTEAVLDSPLRPNAVDAAVERAVVHRATVAWGYMTTLATVGATAPFVGLFGTVYGILQAFVRIGEAQTASLAVVGPAIGEALVATALGLFAAIPAVVGYNYLARRVETLVARARANAHYWAVRSVDEPGARWE